MSRDTADRLSYFQPPGFDRVLVGNWGEQPSAFTIPPPPHDCGLRATKRVQQEGFEPSIPGVETSFPEHVEPNTDKTAQ